MYMHDFPDYFVQGGQNYISYPNTRYHVLQAHLMAALLDTIAVDGCTVSIEVFDMCKTLAAAQSVFGVLCLKRETAAGP